MRTFFILCLATLFCLPSLALGPKKWEVVKKISVNNSMTLDRHEIFEHTRDGKIFFLSQNNNKYFGAYSSDNGKLLYELTFDEGFRGYETSSDGKKILFYSPKKIIVLDILTGSKLFTIHSPSAITALVISPNSDTFVSGHYDGKVKLYDFNNGNQIIQFENHTDKIRSLTYSSNGGKIASASRDGYVNTYNVYPAMTLANYQVTYHGGVYYAEFLPDETYILVEATRTATRFINTVTGSKIRKKGDSCLVLVLIDSNVLCTSRSLYGGQGFIDNIRYFSLQKHIFEDSAIPDTHDPYNGFARYFVDKENRTLGIERLSDLFNDKYVFSIYRLGKDKVEKVSETPFSSGHVLAYSGSEFYTSSIKEIKVYSNLGELKQTLSEHQDKIERVAVSSDGLKLASIDREGMLILWEK